MQNVTFNLSHHSLALSNLAVTWPALLLCITEIQATGRTQAALTGCFAVFLSTPRLIPE
jgi:hypothetical protein